MIDEKKVQTALDEFLKNPYWKGKYEDAPTELSRRATELSFCSSFYIDKIPAKERKEIIAEKDACMNKYSLLDWQFELKYCGHNPFHAICVQKIAELSNAKI
ncbi:MAG: hypothetical protein LIO41_04215 [Ruminococcus sp.]|nr:hypothetical protein [Ruminococcus sp.]